VVAVAGGVVAGTGVGAVAVAVTGKMIVLQF
jgi:hypothetical protein